MSEKRKGGPPGLGPEQEDQRGKGKGKRIKDGMKNGEKKGVRRKSKRGRGEKGKGKVES